VTTKPIKPDGYADHLSGDWKDVPEWAIKRINFLESMLEWNDKSRCPLLDEPCPDVGGDLSCRTVKHCYHYLCDGGCGKTNEIWVSDENLKMIRSNEGREPCRK
jgi:hypothetical protein